MKTVVKLLALLIPLIVLPCHSALSADKGTYEVTPKAKSGSEKWRIGYLEGGPYGNYPLNLKALVDALAAMNWIEQVNWPEPVSGDDTSELWGWLAANVKSNYIQFVKDAFWSCDWQEDKRVEIKKIVTERLRDKKDIDLILAMGTWAGQDLANNDHSVPVIVMSSSDPLRSKIIKSYTDSGLDHVNARVDPTRYVRQLQIFHSIVPFKKLGIAYEMDTDTGRTYAAIEDIEKVAGELDFDIVSCNAPFSGVSNAKAKEAVERCHTQLAPDIDAMYITTHRGVTLDNLPVLLAPLYDRKIPTFSQKGTVEVKHGVLLSIARAGFKYIGTFHAQTIAKIFNGAKPRDLEQIFEDPPRIAINLQAAQMIGWDPSIDILSSADEIYEEITSTE